MIYSAIRLKNDLVVTEDEKINEVILARKIVDRFFSGTDIAGDEDIPMWAAVHSLSYYCAATTLATTAVNNCRRTAAKGKASMSAADCDRLVKSMQHCDEKLPELKAIKEHGWNVFYAEAVDHRGDYSEQRYAGLHAMRELHKWTNSPYDEQRGLADLPHERRGRKYQFSNENHLEEFPTPDPNYWPFWSRPGYLQYYMSNHKRPVAPKAMPRKAEPLVFRGCLHAFFDPRFNVGAPSSSNQQGSGPTAWTYTRETDPWANYGNATGDSNESTLTRPTEQPTTVDHVVPPMAYDPTSESADEDDALPEDEWIYPNIPNPLRYEKYLKTSLTLADRIGTVKLLAQRGFVLKPMIEEAIVPSKATMSTYSSYLRKVTSYVASWTGCVSMRLLRSYRRKSDTEWIRLYNFCMQKTHLGQTHMYLGTKELAALCGVLEGNEQAIRIAFKPIISQRFLMQPSSNVVS